MEQVTSNIFVETTVRGCNPAYVVTRDGVVVIDTPQLPSYAVRMRQECDSRGPIRYLINTEHHIDHIFGNYFFKNSGLVISHKAVLDRFMVVTPELDPFAYAAEAIPTDDPAGAALFPDRETYFADPNKPTLTFDGNITLRVGDHHFHLLHTPGHTPGQIAVHIPEERIVFVGDTVFNGCQTWLYESDVPTWLTTLDFLSALDVDIVIPGHGPVCDKRAFATQKAFLLEWTTAVAIAIAQGWTREECMEHISFLDRFPVDIGQEHMGEFVNRRNAAALYDKLTRPATTRLAKEDRS
jgi:cyclase